MRWIALFVSAACSLVGQYVVVFLRVPIYSTASHLRTAQQLQDALVARTELELGNAVTVDSLRQARAENERLLAELATARVRIANATQDYVDILQHREEQHHIAEERAGSLAATVERLQSELAVLNTELARMRVRDAVRLWL